MYRNRLFLLLLDDHDEVFLCDSAHRHTPMVNNKREHDDDDDDADEEVL